MVEIRDRVQDFLNRYGMDVNSINSEQIIKDFHREIRAGLDGTESSLAMIPSYIEAGTAVPPNKPVIVLDAGGTNLRVCTVSFDNSGSANIKDFKQFQMPGIEKELRATEFYETICNYLEPVINKADSIGFCFSYPSIISKEKDGKLLTWTKEVKVPELVGKYIGDGLLKALESRGHNNKRIILLNDTVSCLLAGKAIGEKRECGSYVGFILGTGTNTAYVESNSSIGKIESTTGSQVMNIESGNFNSFLGGVIDQNYDNSTNNPGKQRLEKMISGRYLGDIYNEVIKQAAKDGLFSAETKEIIESIKVIKTYDLSIFLENPYCEDALFVSDKIKAIDREKLYYIVLALTKRAAKLTAINIATAVIKSGAGHSPLHPVCINVDGSTFHKLYGFRSRVERFLNDILTPLDIFYEIIEVENAPIIGSAIAGLVG